MTDSTCDLPRQLILEHDIMVVPLYLKIGPRSYREGIDIGLEEFYRKMRERKELPTTSQPSPGDFFKIYEKLAGGNNHIISIHISSKLSGTVNSALSAKNMILDEDAAADINIVDSQTASGGLGLMVIRAAEMARDGMGKEEIIANLKEIRSSNRGIALVADLGHLYRGGRISRTQVFIGSLLKMTPLVALEKGELRPHDKALGIEAALRKIVECVRSAPRPPSFIALVSGTLKSEREATSRKISELFPGIRILNMDLGAVIGAHLGPESLAVLWF